MIQTYRKVPRYLLWYCWLRLMLFQMTSQSFDRGYTNAFTNAMVPILRYLYKYDLDRDVRIKEGLQRTRSYYLCEQSFSGIAFAIIVGMEEQKANGQPITGEMITATRTSIIGPMSGLGDTLHGSTTRQIAIAITIPLCLAGHWTSSIAMLILLNVSPFLTAIFGVPQGYQKGSAFVLKLVKNKILKKISHIVTIAVFSLLGSISVNYFVSFLHVNNEANLVRLFAERSLILITIGCFYFALVKKFSTRKLIGISLILGFASSIIYSILM